MIDEGKLSWTSTIGDVLGPVIPGFNPGFAAITLEKLLSHTSGLPTDNEEIAALYYGNAYEATPTEYRRKMISDWGTKHDIKKADITPISASSLSEP